MYEQTESVPDTDSRGTARLVMWFVLVVALLLYGGMVLAQLSVRFVSPSSFAWGLRFIPLEHGQANVVALILSCLPIAAAGRISAQTNRWLMIAALSATFLGGVVFLAIQSVEYENSFRHGPGWGTPVSAAVAGADDATGELGPGDVGAGRGRWQATCRSCHGASGEGVEGQGKDLRQSEFIQDLDDPGLLAFIRVGRLVSDPLNTTGRPMPPKGGNPFLKDPQLMDIVAYIRSIQVPISGASSPDSGDGAAGPDAVVPPDDGDEDGAAPVETSPPEQVESGDEFWIPRWNVPPAALGPTGLSPEALQPAVRPVYADLFFGIFFLMTGVHAIQVLIGLSILVWLIYRAVQIPYHPSHDVPVDLARYYWFFAVVIWIVLFPMFYLIR